MRRLRIFDEDRPASGPTPRLRVDVRVADHPAAGEVNVEVGGGAEEHSGSRFPAVAVLPKAKIGRVRVVQAVAVVVDGDALVGEESNHVLVGRTQIVARGLALRRAWLVRDNDDTVVERADTTNRVGRSGDQPDVLLDRRAFESPVYVVPDELDDHTVAVEEDRGVAHPRPSASNDSHFPGAVTSAGCETRRCQTIAWNSSTWGVRRSGGASTTMQTSAAAAVAPSARPTIPKTPAPTSRASSIARTRFTETLWARFPPPTENTSNASLDESRDVRSHASKLVSHPSSFVLAVISATLSVGAYASKSQSFRKSLTACDAWAAPPPTPRTKSRPRPPRTSASATASASTAAESMERAISPTSLRYIAANESGDVDMTRKRPLVAGER